ncbi:uncharacterized protein Nmlp_2206 [Natronomonas moolapensis 8.8.11]|uniref:Uncharacterized protein n=2 Tax=Halobacteriales TaxID=2235 RepID=M1XQH5_NATM8|nr:hypothetical protein [Natronomonas moolapensis]CCQ36380.1 uncharacterized protein Nmlp_2206 [Natronomonas moolapensis 8.8.11]
MDETAHARAAFSEGIGDIVPEALRKRLEGVLESASMTPGTLTVVTATALDESVDLDTASRRGAGVQMSYEGLRLSRDLIHTDPWSNGDRGEGDMNAIAAEVLVARGFEYLAHTGVAMDVVDAVRHFGRDQTLRETDVAPAELDRRLEADFVRIAVRAGADVALGSIPEPVDTVADELAEELGTDPLPETEAALGGVAERISAAGASPDRTAAGSRSSGT